MADECDHLLLLLGELMDAKASRDKAGWNAAFYLLGRFLSLVLLASTMGGAKTAQRFEEGLRRCLASKEGKVDLGSIIQEALANSTAPPAASAAPLAIPVTEINAKIDAAVAKIVGHRKK